MGRRHLQIYPHRDAAPASPPATARIALRDLLPLIAAAQRMNMLWLRDFLDDEVVVTADLHDVLQAFQSCRPTG